LKPFKLFIAENKIKILAVYLFTVFISTLSFKLSADMRKFFDSSEAMSYDKGYLLLGIIISYIVIFLLFLFSRILSSKILYTGLLNIRKCMLSSLLHTSYEYFINNSAGKIWSEMLSTTGKIGNYFNTVLLVPLNLTEVFVYGIIIFNTSVFGGFIVCAFIPLIIIATFFT